MKIIWQNNYNTGITKVDLQHKKLVDLINRLVDAYEKKTDRTTVEPIFLGLVNYCNYHFTSEELAMQDNNYADYMTHKAEHDIFFKKIDDLKFQYIRGNNAALVYTIEFLKGWLIEHIQVQDKKYVPILMGSFD